MNTAILATLRAVPAGTTLRVTYQAEGRTEPKDYYGTIEEVGESHGRAFFVLRTADGIRRFVCVAERLKGILPADVVEPAPKPQRKRRGARSLREDSGFSKREARALGGLIAP